MQLREHPRLYIWPPQWTVALESAALSSDESERVILRKAEIKPPYIWISGEYGPKIYFSIIKTLVDPKFLDLFYLKLTNSIGQTIREIGDSEWVE